MHFSYHPICRCRLCIASSASQGILFHFWILECFYHASDRSGIVYASHTFPYHHQGTTDSCSTYPPRTSHDYEGSHLGNHSLLTKRKKDMSEYVVWNSLGCEKIALHYITKRTYTSVKISASHIVPVLKTIAVSSTFSPIIHFIIEQVADFLSRHKSEQNAEKEWNLRIFHSSIFLITLVKSRAA